MGQRVKLSASSSHMWQVKNSHTKIYPKLSKTSLSTVPIVPFVPFLARSIRESESENVKIIKELRSTPKPSNSTMFMLILFDDQRSAKSEQEEE